MVEVTGEATGEVSGEAMVVEEAIFLQCTRHIQEEATAAAEVIRGTVIPDLRLILPSTMVRKIIHLCLYSFIFNLCIILGYGNGYGYNGYGI